MEEKEEEGRDQTHDFSSAILFFRSQLNGTRIFLLLLLLLLLLIVALILGPKNPYRPFYARYCTWACTLLARGLLCSSLWALQAVLCAEHNMLPAQHQRKGSLRTSPLHSSTLLQHHGHWRNLGPELLDVALLSFKDSFFLDTILGH